MNIVWYALMLWGTQRAPLPRVTSAHTLCKMAKGQGLLLFLHKSSAYPGTSVQYIRHYVHPINSQPNHIELSLFIYLFIYCIV